MALHLPMIPHPVPLAAGASLPALDEQVGAMVQGVLTLEAESATCEDLDRRFRTERDLDCAVVVQDGEPTHLVTREHYYAKTGGPYGFTLYQKKWVEAVAKESPLVVDSAVTVLSLANLALSRPREDQYDPLVVTGSDRRVLGIVTIRQLIQKAAQLEVKTALLSHPLTKLPGTTVVQQWIERGLAADEDGSLTVLFADLDGFKEYNDAYGLLQGDELVRTTARVLAEAADLLGPETRLGHASGDDFVLVSPHPIDVDSLRVLCARFDREKLSLFDPADLARGTFRARDEKGNAVKVPLNTLRLVVVASRPLASARHPAIFSQVAASLRRKAKTLTAALGRSAFVANHWQSEEDW